MSKGLISGLESKQEPLEKWTKRSKLAINQEKCIRFALKCPILVDILSIMGLAKNTAD